jgi:hypothetical protein
MYTFLIYMGSNKRVLEVSLLTLGMISNILMAYSNLQFNRYFVPVQQKFNLNINSGETRPTLLQWVATFRTQIMLNAPGLSSNGAFLTYT